MRFLKEAFAAAPGAVMAAPLVIALDIFGLIGRLTNG